MTTTTPGEVELRQSVSNLLSGPIFIAIVDVVVVVSQFFHNGPGATLLAVCGAILVLDAVMTAYMLHNMGSTLVVTADSITFTRRQGHSSNQSVITRTPQSTLSFRTARNGPMGSQYTGYILKLRDNASGDEVFAGAFGRRRVQQACESQGWTFS
jgi:hypothetical protein